MVQHSQDLNNDIPIMIKLEVIEMINNHSLELKIYANPMFKYFDTRQIVKIVDDTKKNEPNKHNNRLK